MICANSSTLREHLRVKRDIELENNAALKYDFIPKIDPSKNGKVLPYVPKNIKRRLLLTAEQKERLRQEALDRRAVYYSSYLEKFGHLPCNEDVAISKSEKKKEIEDVKSAMASQLNSTRNAEPYSLKKTLNLLEDYRRLFPKFLSELVLKENFELTKSPGTNRILRAWLSSGRVFSF